MMMMMTFITRRGEGGGGRGGKEVKGVKGMIKHPGPSSACVLLGQTGSPFGRLMTQRDP